MVTAHVVSSFRRSLRGFWHTRRPKRAALLGATLATLLVMPQAQVPAQFLRLADLSTAVPGGGYLGGGETFTSLSAPAIAGQNVVFVANSAVSPFEVGGIYAVHSNGGGSVRELVSRRTWLPEFTGPRSGPSAPNNQGEGVFAGFGFSALDIDDRRVGFVAATLPTISSFEIGRNAYVVNFDGSGLQHIYRTPVGTIGNLEVAQDRVVVHAGSPVGLQQFGTAGNRTVVESGTPITPGSSATFLLSGAEYTAYRGGISFAAFVSGFGNSLWRMNDTDTDFVLLRQGGASGVPTAPFPLISMQRLSADTVGALTFQGQGGSAQSGIFTQRTSSDSGMLRREFDTIASTHMLAPSGKGNFSEFHMLATRSRRVFSTSVGGPTTDYLEVDVAFVATDGSGKRAIYAYSDEQVRRVGPLPQPQRVIGVGDTLDGKKISFVEISRNAIGSELSVGETIAFRTRFEDNSEAIYVVPIQQIMPRSGVNVSAQLGFGAPALRQTAAGESSASAAVASGDRTASGNGSASPFTGAVGVAAAAHDGGTVRVQATQQFVVLGETPGDPVDVDFGFNLSGTLGVEDRGCSPCFAKVSLRALVYLFGAPPIVLFDGELQAFGNGTIDRLGAYAEPSSVGDVLGHPDPFGDGREAYGFSVHSTRVFEDAVRSRVGDTLAVQYNLEVEASGSAIADFSHTLTAEAGINSGDASLAALHLAPIPEPGQFVLMLCGITMLIVRMSRQWRRDQRLVGILKGSARHA